MQEVAEAAMGRNPETELGEEGAGARLGRDPRVETAGLEAQVEMGRDPVVKWRDLSFQSILLALSRHQGRPRTTSKAIGVMKALSVHDCSADATVNTVQWVIVALAIESSASFRGVGLASLRGQSRNALAIVGEISIEEHPGSKRQFK